MNNKNVFFNLIDPVLNLVDNGRFFKDPFKWIYTLLAVLNLLFPLVMLYTIISSELFSYLPGKGIFALILLWLVVAFACWIGFQIWWNRKDKVTQTSVENDRFVATPIFTHFIQTMGEWLGAFYAIVGFGVGLIVTIIMGEEGSYLLSAVGLDMVSVGVTAIILAPVVGFLIVVVARALAELYRALVEIANNTRKSA